MRKILLILIQILLLLAILQSSFAQQFLGEATTTVKQWYTSLIEVPERRKIMQLRDTFMRNNMSLQPHQVDYVLDVTDNADKLDTFYQAYCQSKDKNPFLYGANLKKFCADIQSSELLKDCTL